MMLFRKKPVVVEAVRITKEVLKEKSLGETYQPEDGNLYHITYSEEGVLIETLEGTMAGFIGDWVIKGVHNELYPCKDEIFRKTYELIEDDG